MSEEKQFKLRPVFENFETAIKTWWKHLLKFVRLYLWGLLFTLIPILIFAFILGTGLLLGLQKSPAFIALAAFIGFWAVIFALYFAIRTYLSMYLLIKKNYAGREFKIYEESAEYFWSYLSVVILTTILIFLWLIALVIPALVFSIFYAFAVYALIFEDKRDIDAIRRSYQLVRGYWWAVLGRYLLLGLVVWIFMMIISLPITIAGTDSTFAIVWSVLIQIVNYLIGPIFMLYAYQIYQDLVEIKK